MSIGTGNGTYPPLNSEDHKGKSCYGNSKAAWQLESISETNERETIKR